MNITKYSAIFSMAILLSGALAITFSFFIADAQALQDNHFKKFKVKKFKCINFNLNIDGEEKFSSPNDKFPSCLNINRN